MSKKNSLINISPNLSEDAEDKLISAAERATEKLIDVSGKAAVKLADTSARTIEKIADTYQDVKRIQQEKEQEEKRREHEREMESRRARRPIVIAITVLALIALVYCWVVPIDNRRKVLFSMILVGLIIYFIKKI